jgi:hypothetical protein
MQTTLWIIAAIAVVALVVGVVRAARRGRGALVATAPLTISVTEPVVDVLESPRHAAEARAALRAAAGPHGGTRRRDT